MRSAYRQERSMRYRGTRHLGQLLQPLADLGIGRKGAPIRSQARSVIAGDRIRKPRCHCRVFKGCFFLFGTALRHRACRWQRDLHRRRDGPRKNLWLSQRRRYGRAAGRMRRGVFGGPWWQGGAAARRQTHHGRGSRKEAPVSALRHGWRCRRRGGGVKWLKLGHTGVNSTKIQRGVLAGAVGDGEMLPGSSR